MQIGELFVNLGIKGSDKTVGAITNVKKGLSETASVSLEAKAAIVSAMYALERLFQTSGSRGTSLTNFNALTGESVQMLQKWEYAGQQAGVSAQEFEGSLKAVKSAMTNMLLGKGAPEGLGLLANKVGFDPKKARETFYVLEQMQKFARSMPADVGNAVLKSFGGSESVIAAMRRNAYRPEIFARAPVYSDKELGALDRANIAWSNLGTKIEMAMGRFNAAHGGQLVKDISMITDSVLKLINAFQKLAENTHFFAALSKTLEIIASSIERTAVVLGGSEKDRTKLGDQIIKNLNEKDTRPLYQKLGLSYGDVGGLLKDIGGAPISRSPQSTSQGQKVEVNQTLNFQHEGKDHVKTGDSVKKAAQHFLRQSPVQGQAS